MVAALTAAGSDPKTISQIPGAPGADEAGGEQIRPLPHPQHRPFHPGQHAGEEQGRGGTMLGIRAGAGDFMERAQKQAAGWKGTVEEGDVEGDAPGNPRAVAAFDPRYLVAQAGESLGSGGR